MNWYLRGFGLQTAMRAPEDDEGFDFEDDADPDAEGELEDEGDDEVDLDEEGDDTEEDQDDPPPRSRGESRTAKLAREAKDLREENERLRREGQARQAAPVETAQPRETQEQFNARVAAMGDVERIAYLADLNARNTNAQLADMKFQLADSTDKIGFDSFCSSNSEAKKLSGEVDKRLADYRKGGVNIPRMDVLKHILGERALDNLGRSRSRAERGAQARRDQQSARPPAGRGDVAREGREAGSSKAARDRRVENMKI